MFGARLYYEMSCFTPNAAMFITGAESKSKNFNRANINDTEEKKKGKKER